MNNSIREGDGGGEGGVGPSPEPRLVRRLRDGDTRALARAISLVENGSPEAPAILSGCFPYSQKALRIGVTGAPGAGKSTLVDQLSRHFRSAGKEVGVIAVDPSSPFTGGAILGDRIRLQQQNSADPGLYIRSMATRGALGGLALATSDVSLLLEASGKHVILIETVGVGQDEVEIARLADVTLLVLVPGMGDDVQSLKAGVMEIADFYVINKSDREGADRLEQEIRALQSLVAHHRRLDWTPPILRTVASAGDGIPSLVEAIGRMEAWLHQDEHLTRRRSQNWQRRLDGMLHAELLRRARSNGLTPAQISEYAARIASGALDPWKLVPELMVRLLGGHAEEKPSL